MSLKTFTTKLDKSTIDALKAMSIKTRIPQSELIREGIALMLTRHKEDILEPKLKSEIENLLQEDRNLLKRLYDK